MATVLQIRTFPVAGEPGERHEVCAVTADGLEGDRRKKAPVHLVGAADASRRANLVLDLTPEQVRAAIGRRLRVGSVVLGLGDVSGGCPGAYGDVLEPGTVRVGDPVEVLDDAD